jgi:hypothetical protein
MSGFRSALPIPLGINRGAFVQPLGYRTLPWFMGGRPEGEEPPVPPPPPPPTIAGGWSDWMPRKPRRKDEDEEQKEVERPLEVVTTDKVVTGVVQAVPPLPAWRDPAQDSEVARLVRRENESKAAFKRRLKKIIAADDDWLMLH